MRIVVGHRNLRMHAKDEDRPINLAMSRRAAVSLLMAIDFRIKHACEYRPSFANDSLTAADPTLRGHYADQALTSLRMELHDEIAADAAECTR